MKLIIKKFDELTNKELYEIIRARVDVFVVEQNCPYKELDGIDYRAVHLFYEDEEGKILAYIRVFEKDRTTAQIGRVITAVRGKGYGLMIINAGINYLKAFPQYKKIYLEAQCYAIGFYEKAGFKVVSEPFLEDGIRHVKMEKELK